MKYFKGQGLSQINQEDIEWYYRTQDESDIAVFKKALEIANNDERVEWRRGEIYSIGLYFDWARNVKASIKCFMLAAALGVDEAAVILITQFYINYEEKEYKDIEELLKWRQGVSKLDIKMALTGYLLAKINSDEDAKLECDDYPPDVIGEVLGNLSYDLGIIYSEGIDAPADKNEAFKLFKLAAAQGHKDALVKVYGVPEDADAQYELSYVYYGFYYEEESLKWLRLAAEQGHADAQYDLSDRLYDKTEALKWLRLAAKQGHEEAQQALGEHQRDSLLSLNESVKRVRPAAEQGIAEAQYRLGEIYSGNDTEQSLKWFKLAAEQGHAKAKFTLRNFYVDKDPREALKWSTMSAEQGQAKAAYEPSAAQYALGMHYKSKANLSPKKSIKWFKLAAEKGHANAQYELGMRYADLDTRESIKWFKLAAEQGHEDALQYIADCNEPVWSQKDDETAKTGSEHALDVRSTSGETLIGCEDFDLRLIDFLAEQFEKVSGLDLHNDPLAMQRLKEAAEKAKIELSSAQQAEINLPYITSGPNGPQHLVQILTRAKFESLAEDFVDKSMMPLETALDDAPVRIRLGKIKGGSVENINRSQNQKAESKAIEKEYKDKAAEASVPQPTTNQKPSQENYAQAFTELENNKMKVGLWAMAFAHSENAEEAKKSYIKLRAEELNNQREGASATAIASGSKKKLAERIASAGGRGHFFTKDGVKDGLISAETLAGIQGSIAAGLLSADEFTLWAAGSKAAATAGKQVERNALTSKVSTSLASFRAMIETAYLNLHPAEADEAEAPITGAELRKRLSDLIADVAAVEPKHDN